MITVDVFKTDNQFGFLLNFRNEEQLKDFLHYNQNFELSGFMTGERASGIVANTHGTIECKNCGRDDWQIWKHEDKDGKISFTIECTQCFAEIPLEIPLAE